MLIHSKHHNFSFVKARDMINSVFFIEKNAAFTWYNLFNKLFNSNGFIIQICKITILLFLVKHGQIDVIISTLSWFVDSTLHFFSSFKVPSELSSYDKLFSARRAFRSIFHYLHKQVTCKSFTYLKMS